MSAGWIRQKSWQKINLPTPFEMPTISLATLFVNKKWFFIGYFFTASAIACTPGVSIDVFFENESARLPAQEVKKLTNWLIDLKLKYPNHDFTIVGGHAAATEIPAKELARRRAQSVKNLFVLMGLEAERIHVDVAESYNLPLAGVSPRRVEVDFFPGCPNGCCPAAEQR